MNAADDKETEDINIDKGEVLDNKKASRCCTNVTINNCNSSKNGDSSIISTSSKVLNGNSQHNDYHGKSFTDRPSVSISSSINGISSHHVDCNKYSNGSTSSNSARPKVRTVVCNIPNGASEQSSAQKVNNNFVTTKFDKLQNGNQEINGMDIYLRNNVDISTSMTVDKCPQKVRNNVHNRGVCGDDWNSSSENEGEDEEECCFYTYKGDSNQMADLPSSFFRLDTNVSRGNAGSRSSSPDMDYLEMDFDPGPSNERDSPSISDSDGFDICTQSRPITPLPVAEECEPQAVAEVEDNTNNLDLDVVIPALTKPTSPLPQLSAQGGLPAQSPIAEEPSTSASADIAERCDTFGYHVGYRDSSSSGEINSYCGALSLPLPVTTVESNFEPQKYNLLSTDFQCTMGKIMSTDTQATLLSDHEDLSLHSEDTSSEQSSMERVMLWSELEASAKQVNQITISGCGATAVVNVMLALNLNFSLDRVKEAVGVRLRRDTAPLPEYLFSRSVAGATHHDMIRGLEIVSQGSLFARFFPMYPARNFSLSRWLSYWMIRGAVPIVTVNLQRGPYPISHMPDCWHHQMVFGVGPKGVYLTNPIECINEASLITLLCSPPVLKIRRKDVTDRWTPDTNLRPLMLHHNHAWNRLNVLGQVVSVIRDSQRSPTPNCPSLTSHLTIPASYSSGITLVIPRESPGFYDLTVAPELPVVQINACSSIW